MVRRYKGSSDLRMRRKLTLYPWLILFDSGALCLNISRGMAPINLDDIIHYRPPAKKPQFQPLRIPSSHTRIHSQSSWGKPAPTHPFLLGQYWCSSLPFSGHTPYLQSHFHSSGEPEMSLAPHELAEEVAIDCSNEFDIDFLNSNSGSDANLAVCSTNRDVGDDISGSGSGLGRYDQYPDGTRSLLF